MYMLSSANTTHSIKTNQPTKQKGTEALLLTGITKKKTRYAMINGLGGITQ